MLVASDDPFSRQAFSSAARTRGINVLAADSVTAVAERLARELEPDVVVMDVQLAAVEALRSLRRVRAEVPNARILAFSTPAGTEFGLLCIHAGASGYLSKDIDFDALPRVLHSLGRGEAVISRAFATDLVERLRAHSPRGPSGARRAVSAPERQVLELIRSGRTLAAAAAELGIGISTVQRHLASARRKLSACRVRDGGAAIPFPRNANRARKPRAGGSHD